MRAENTFSVNVFCREKKGTSLGILYLRIAIDNQTRELSLKESIPMERWNAQRQMVAGSATEIKDLNKYIESIKFRVRQKYRVLQDREEPVTAEILKEAFLGRTKPNKGKTLNELMTYHMKLEGDKLAWGTMKNYVTTESYVRNFIKERYNADDLYLVDLQKTFIVEFEHYVRNNPMKKHDPCKGNGIIKHTERLKKMINWARQLGWIKVDPFVDHKLHFKKYKRIRLDMTELRRIELQEFANLVVAYVKDLFLFSCYTGLAYSDVMALRPRNLERENNGTLWCKIYRQKSDEYAAIPLLPQAIAYIEKYRNNPKSQNKGVVFPFITNQEVNRHLKTIARVCNIDKYVTFHLARHTFATAITLKNGVPIETVSKMLGHKKITTTQLYAEVDEEKINNDMIVLQRRLNWSNEF